MSNTSPTHRSAGTGDGYPAFVNASSPAVIPPPPKTFPLVNASCASLRESEAESKGVEVCASGLKARDPGRRDAPGEKVLKDRRSPRERGRVGTGVRQNAPDVRPGHHLRRPHVRPHVLQRHERGDQRAVRARAGVLRVRVQRLVLRAGLRAQRGELRELRVGRQKRRQRRADASKKRQQHAQGRSIQSDVGVEFKGSLRNDVHHANGVVWGPVYRTYLSTGLESDSLRSRRPDGDATSPKYRALAAWRACAGCTGIVLATARARRRRI
eukprot:31116-Pelagococcus_subviridis.AAC.2